MKEVDEIVSEIDAALHVSPAIDELLVSDDFLEGITAVAKKRKPAWKNS